MKDVETSVTVIEIPIFPLPNVVFFPRTLLPLHIFEPRYKRMVSEALSGNRRIGMVLRRQPEDRPFQGGSSLHSIGGLGQIKEVEELEDGKFDIVLGGVSRFRILSLVQDRPYRRARVELLSDLYRERPEDRQQGFDLVASYRELAGLEQLSEQEEKILRKADLITLVNSICSALPISPADRQLLLELDDVRERAEALERVLRHLLSQKEFVQQYDHIRPPDPNLN